MASVPRIALIHALRDSMVPIWDAFTGGWPDANTFNLLDDSLSSDLAADGHLSQAIVDRFLTLARYARQAGTNDHKTDAILFTCSAFSPAIDAVKRDMDIPVLSPNEAAFEQALAIGGRVGLVVTFPPSEQSLSEELKSAAAEQNVSIQVAAAVAEGALAALQTGDTETHDALIADAVSALGDVSCAILGQFSMARAARAVKTKTSVPVITTPAAAVTRLRDLLS